MKQDLAIPEAALRSRIADLERQLTEEGGYKVDPNAEGAAEHRGYKRGKIEGYAEAITDIAPLIEAIMDHSGDLFSALTKLQGEGRKVAEWVERAGKNRTEEPRPVETNPGIT